jgi:hypothetical protein
MSISIYWRPVNAGKKRIGGGSSFFTALQNEFGQRPHLTQAEIPWLKGYKAAGFDPSGADDLIDALEHCDEIEVTGEY